MQGTDGKKRPRSMLVSPQLRPGGTDAAFCFVFIAFLLRSENKGRGMTGMMTEA